MGAPSLPVVFDLVVLETVDSTNEEAKRRAATPEEEGGPRDGALIWAGRQEIGKGRRDRGWESPPGNLYCSLILRPERPPAEAAELAFVMALSAGQAVAGAAAPMTALTYKWPNDVLLNGKKVAGVLLEAGPLRDGVVSYLVAGLGVNVTSSPPPDRVRYPATSVIAEGGVEGTVESVLQGFARAFQHWAGRWVEQGFPVIRKAWLNHAAGKGEEISVDLGSETVTGLFCDLSEDGQLVLLQSDGAVRRVATGDVLLPGL